MNPEFVLLGAGLASAATLLAWISWRSPRPEMKCAELRFSENVSEASVQAVLRAISGLPLSSRIIFEVIGGPGGIRHLIRAEAATLKSLTATLHAQLPDCSLREVEAEAELDLTQALRIRFRGPGRHVLLREDQSVETSAGLLAAFSGAVDSKDNLLLRLVIRPSRVPRLEQETPRQSANTTLALISGIGLHGITTAAHRALMRKYSARPLRVSFLAGTTCGNLKFGWQLLGRITALLRSRHGQLGWVRVSRVGRLLLPRISRADSFLSRHLGFACLSVEELAGLLAWPIDGPRIHGLRFGVAPVLPPPRQMPRSGRVVGMSDATGRTQTPLVQPVAGGLQHMAIVGATGSGKSALALNLITQDLEAGRGALVLDMKGDLVDDLLARVPQKRLADVVLLDPARRGPQPGLELFAHSGQADDAELTADLLLGTFKELYRDSWGIRTEMFLRLGLVTLAHTEGANLTDLPRLFGDTGLRKAALGHAQDPWLSSAWQRFEALSKADRQQQLAPALSKLEQLLARRSLRSVLGHDQPSLRFSEVLSRGSIVLVRLPAGLLGKPTTELLAALVLWRFFSAVEGRAALPPSKRTPFFAYVDEISALGGLPLPVGDLLERARGLGVGTVLMPQAISQLPVDLARTLTANVGSVVAFRQSVMREAKTLSELLPGVTPEGLLHLEPFGVATRLSLGPGQVTPVMTGKTLPPPKRISKASEVRRAAGARYGQTLGARRAEGDPERKPTNVVELPGRRRREP